MQGNRLLIRYLSSGLRYPTIGFVIVQAIISFVTFICIFFIDFVTVHRTNQLINIPKDIKCFITYIVST